MNSYGLEDIGQSRAIPIIGWMEKLWMLVGCYGLKAIPIMEQRQFYILNIVGNGWWEIWTEINYCGFYVKLN